jgi:hypothetical protein
MSKAAELAALIGSGQAQIASNLIINGSNQISQRATSSTSSGYQTVDRTRAEFSGASVTQSQQALTSGGPYDDGHRFFFRCANTSTSSATSAYLQINQEIEAQNVATSGWKFTSSSSYLTMSFWARSSLAGTYNVLLKSHDGTAQGFSSAFTLVADTWKKISVTIPGNSSITINNDNGIGLRCYVVPHLGTDYTTSGHTSDAWQTLDNNNLVPDYAQNWSNTASATFDMTGWQVEVGQVSTPFPHEDIGTTLAKCQRYYQRIQCDTAYDAIMDGFHLVASQFYAMHTFPVSMRDVPTMGESGTISIVSNGADRAPDSFILNRATKEVIQTFCDMSTNNGTTGHGGQIRNNNDADQFVEFKSEL